MNDSIERAERLFPAEEIARLAEMASFPSSTDLALFGEFLRTAAAFYFEDLKEADFNRVRRDIAAIYAGRIGIDAVSQAALRLLKLRADRLGVAWPPCDEDLRRLAAFGATLAEDSRREKSRRRKILKPELFAPAPNRNPRKRTAECIFYARLRVTAKYATGEEPPKTATVRASRISNETLIGPFPRMVREVFRICGSPHVDVANLMKQCGAYQRPDRAMRKT